MILNASNSIVGNVPKNKIISSRFEEKIQTILLSTSKEDKKLLDIL